jgi:nicotinamide phosphoribosyltransferase
MKATWAVVNGEERFLSKDPKTDDGTKKSLTGHVVVFDKGDGIKFKDGLTFKEEVGTFGNLLEVKFANGELYNEQSFADIREHLVNQ